MSPGTDRLLAGDNQGNRQVMLAAATKWSLWLLKKTAIALSLGLLCLIVGAGCVLLPFVIPLGIVALTLLLLLWVAPDLKRVPGNICVRSFYLFVFVSLSVPFYVAFIIPGVPFLSIRRVVVYAFVLCNIVALSTSSELRARFWANAKSLPMLKYFLLGFLVFNLVSTLTSTYLALSLNTFIQGSLNWFFPAIVVVIWIDTRRKVEMLFLVFLTCVFSDAILGAIETYLKVPPLWKMLPESARAYIISGNGIAARLDTGMFRDGAYRAVSSFTTSLLWAQMIGMLVPVAGYFVAHGVNWRERSIGLGGLALCILSLALARSRGGYASTLVAGTVFMMAWAVREAYLNRQSLAGPILLALASIGAAAVAFALVFVTAARFLVFGSGSTAISDTGRELEWATALPKIWASPIWGYGFGTAGVVVDYRTALDAISLDDYRIDVLIEGGVIGAILYYGLVGLALFFALRAYLFHREKMASYGIVIASSLSAYLLYQSKLSQQDNLVVVMIMVGLCFSVWKGMQAESAEAGRNLDPARDAVGVRLPLVGPGKLAARSRWDHPGRFPA